jgi:NAD(P)H-dependent flavin oxidoreductase YrpB (nitropropane dioxygenase family)
VLATPLCDQLGVQLPIVQAPIGSAATPQLAAAVANAGGLGMLALTWVTPRQAVDRVRRVRQLTDRPFGVNLVLDFPIDDILSACLGEGVPVISTFWGDPVSVTERVHAAGGIGDGRGLAAVLALGAQAGWLGSRFLTATEAATHEVYRRQVLAAAPQDAVYARCFDGGWPDAAHRVIRNSTISDWEAAGCPAAPGRPGEGAVVATDRRGRPQLRYGDMIPVPGMTGELEAMALYAGQSVGLIHEVAPAARIVAAVASQAARILASFGKAGAAGAAHKPVPAWNEEAR